MSLIIFNGLAHFIISHIIILLIRLTLELQIFNLLSLLEHELPYLMYRLLLNFCGLFDLLADLANDLALEVARELLGNDPKDLIFQVVVLDLPVV